jgi:hypothetical protein
MNVSKFAGKCVAECFFHHARPDLVKLYPDLDSVPLEYLTRIIGVEGLYQEVFVPQWVNLFTEAYNDSLLMSDGVKQALLVEFPSHSQSLVKPVNAFGFLHNYSLRMRGLDNFGSVWGSFRRLNVDFAFQGVSASLMKFSDPILQPLAEQVALAGHPMWAGTPVAAEEANVYEQDATFDKTVSRFMSGANMVVDLLSMGLFVPDYEHTDKFLHLFDQQLSEHFRFMREFQVMLETRKPLLAVS